MLINNNLRRILAKKCPPIMAVASGAIPAQQMDVHILSPKLLHQNLREFSISSNLSKDKREKLKQKKTMNISNLKSNSNNKRDFLDDDDEEGTIKKATTSSTATPEELALKAVTEMDAYYKSLVDNISKHMSLTVNLKTYEDLPITLANGETHKLFRLARITMRNPGLIAINFSDSPGAIKPAKDALQSMGDHMNIQQDGIMMYVPVPKITRERREELANKVSGAILNEYKLALREIHNNYIRKLDKSTKEKDILVKLKNGLLSEMHKFVTKGEAKLKERKEALLSEIL